MWVKSKLTCSWSYSVKSPVDLMGLLGNAGRHLGRFYLHVTPPKALLTCTQLTLHVTPLTALLRRYPPLHCLTASLLPHLNGDEIGVDDQQRAVAAKHLEDNPTWKSIFM